MLAPLTTSILPTIWGEPESYQDVDNFYTSKLVSRPRPVYFAAEFTPRPR